MQYTQEHRARTGVLIRTNPIESQQRADFGWHIAKEMARLDIGQLVPVKETEVIAVKAAGRGRRPDMFSVIDIRQLRSISKMLQRIR
ncbi:MAG: UDP-2,3-diacylglucosamine diphosphatase LpxI [Phycisphaerales bacterium]|nr:UDP-2,3-diacylglucosamine diphosphatase LpxI [Phycisphaerales bacterium]